MVFWVSLNHRFDDTHDDILLLKSFVYEIHDSEEEEEEETSEEDIVQICETLFHDAKSAYIVFGYNLSLVLCFDVHKKRFLDLNPENTILVPTSRDDLFCEFVARMLINSRFTHMRWKVPFAVVSLAPLLAIHISQNTSVNVRAIVDSKRNLDVDILFTNFGNIKYDFVIYWDETAIPSRWIVAPEEGVWDPAHPQNYYYYKRRLDYWHEKYGVLEGERSNEWVPPGRTTAIKIRRIQNLYTYYRATFVRMIIDIVPLSSEFGARFNKWIHAMPARLLQVAVEGGNFLAAFPNQISEFNAMYLELCMYFAYQFRSKYAFLFADSQIWRLHHWMNMFVLAERLGLLE